ncbi:Helix-turn-helix domain [Plesiomonas shigelloides]|uniref:helix-turn-helix domain-containing protein n=1 Tax=Plesiomonas shigelloides TaxID=703 RepID=UPI000DF94982|nr:helix-turn-helix transcriptional regulator [Plesiomonas shigelloides]SUB63221.1 Helix-turn-helix domain [Plesiomonas shigelloides]
MQTPLRKVRIENNLTITEVASAIKIDVGNLSRIERGKQLTSLSTAEKLVEFFGGSISAMEILYPQQFMKSGCKPT